MKKLRIKYLFKILSLFLFVLSICLSYYFNNKYTFKSVDGFATGIITSIYRFDNYTKLTINSKQNFISYIKGKNSLDIGDIVDFKFKSKEVINANIFNNFNYYNYLRQKNISFYTDIVNHKKVSFSNYFKLKKFITNKINKRKSKAYLSNFILSDKTYIDVDIKNNLNFTGILHLFSVSGFHVIFLLGIINKFLSFILKSKTIKHVIILIISIVYLYLTSFSLPLLRAILSYHITYFLNQHNVKISNNIKFLFIFSLCLLFKPYDIYSTGFYYTFVLCFFLINFYKAKKNYFLDLISVSFFCFIISAPISLFLNYNINVLSVLFSSIFSVLICYLVYPLCFCAIFFSWADNFLFNLTLMLEKIINFFSKFDSFIITVPKFSILFLIVFYIFLYIYFKYKNKKIFIFIIFLFIIIKIKPYFDLNYYVYFLNVKQGDMSVIAHKGNVTVIDTGGIKDDLYLNKNISTFISSVSVGKINTLIITHGDYDHMGEAISLVENFKVEKVIFNCGEFIELEKKLIKVLDKKKISYYSCIKELNIADNKLYFLNNKDYGNENDNSSVIYTELNNHKFLFMGDAGVEVEEDLINKYNLQDIDVLKVGHHGSKTSSGQGFISEINPKYSVISVGKNNRYGHPNDNVLDNLEGSKIYRTDQDGSIMFKIKNNKLEIKTCAP